MSAIVETVNVVENNIVDNVVIHKPLTYLPGKHGKFAVYLHWLLQKFSIHAPPELVKPASDALIAITSLHTKDFAGQVAFYEQFFAEEKDAAKALKQLVKLANKPVKKAVPPVPVEREKVVKEPKAKVIKEPKEKVIKEPKEKIVKEPKAKVIKEKVIKEPKVVPPVPMERVKEVKEKKAKKEKKATSEETITNNDIISQIVFRANSIDSAAEEMDIPLVEVSDRVLEESESAEPKESGVTVLVDNVITVPIDNVVNALSPVPVEREKVVKEKVVKEKVVKEPKVVTQERDKVVKEKVVKDKVVKAVPVKVVKDKVVKDKVMKEPKAVVPVLSEPKPKPESESEFISEDMVGDSDSESVELQVIRVTVNGIDCYQDDNGALYSLDLIPI